MNPRTQAVLDSMKKEDAQKEMTEHEKELEMMKMEEIKMDETEMYKNLPEGIY